mgnify:FL=1|jgi:hypothetical protein
MGPRDNRILAFAMVTLLYVLFCFQTVDKTTSDTSLSCPRCPIPTCPDIICGSLEEKQHCPDCICGSMEEKPKELVDQEASSFKGDCEMKYWDSKYVAEGGAEGIKKGYSGIYEDLVSLIGQTPKNGLPLTLYSLTDDDQVWNVEVRL